MADISKSRDHEMDLAELRPKLEELAEEMASKFGIKCRWEGDTCHLSGPALKNGLLKMTPRTVSIELTLGAMAKIFKGQIEKELDKRIAKLFGPLV